MARIRKYLLSRWRRIRSSRANLALLAAGVLLVLLAVLWRLAVAPALKVVRTDFDDLRAFRGVLDKPVTGDGIAPERQGVTRFGLSAWTHNPTNLSTPGLSVVGVQFYLQEAGTRQTLYEGEKLYAVDRRTGELTGDETAGGGAGYFVVFPFDTPAGPVPFWSEGTGRTFPATFVEESERGGVPVYDFRVEYSDEPMVSPPPGFPGEITGLELKEMLAEPGLVVADSRAMQPVYTESVLVDLAVEPTMGTIVTAPRYLAGWSISFEDDRGEEHTRPLATVELEETEDSISEGVDTAKTEVAKYRLQFAYIPLGLLLLGLACVVVGGFVGLPGRRENAGQTRSV
jgi:hypothetical protein